MLKKLQKMLKINILIQRQAYDCDNNNNNNREEVEYRPAYI